MEGTVSDQSGIYWLVASVISSLLTIVTIGVMLWLRYGSSRSTGDCSILRSALNRRPRTYLPFTRELAKGVMGLRPL